ncbi:hypothetical protein CSUI_008546 [Cystoisospora suis]|uniref:Uncharacterized protein n=1 Tax=Cystoisospora suis TaxID=483139 RepID=A0A2C6KMB9_9APIC|nr:hypothetical protein CSUI_008546 [Cystoisospora suis]
MLHQEIRGVPPVGRGSCAGYHCLFRHVPTPPVNRGRPSEALADERDRQLFVSRYFADVAEHVSFSSQSDRKLLTSAEMSHADDFVGVDVLTRTPHCRNTSQPLCVSASPSGLASSSAGEPSARNPVLDALVGSEVDKSAVSCHDSPVPVFMDQFCLFYSRDSNAATKTSDLVTSGPGLDSEFDVWSLGKTSSSALRCATIPTSSSSSEQSFRGSLCRLDDATSLFDVQGSRTIHPVYAETACHGRAPDDVSAGSDVSTDSSHEGATPSGDLSCEALQAGCTHGGHIRHMRRLRNGHYRRILGGWHETATEQDGSQEKLSDSSRFDLLGWCCLVGPSESEERTRTGGRGPKKPCTKCEKLEQKIRDLESRLNSVRSGNDDLIENLRAKNDELKTELGIADRRIAAQKETERELQDELERLRRRNSQATRGSMIANQGEHLHSNNLVGLQQDEADPEPEVIPRAEMTDTGVQTKRVGVVMIKSMPLKEGVFIDALMGGKCCKMALRVDYGLRLIVLNRRDVIKFVVILRIAQLVTAHKELTELLSQKRIRQAHSWDEDDLDNLVALRVSALNREELIFCAFSSPLLRDIFVEHTKQLRYSVEAEKGRINNKGFEGENMAGEWIVGQQSLQNTETGRLGTQQEFSGSEGDSSVDEIQEAPSGVRESSSWNGRTMT